MSLGSFMGQWKNWALDASVACPDGGFAFIPVTGDPGSDDCEFITGFTVISDECPGKLVAVIHEGGDNEAELWARAHANDVARLKGES